MTIFGKAAETYATMGWRVFPCELRGKRPAVIDGQRIRWTEQATDDLETVRAWWQAMPDANVGLVTGWPGPGVVIDIDKPELMTAVDWPETLTAKTGSGGFHLYYQPRETLSNKTGNLPKGIDVRGCGTGYVIAPPSMHASGQPYEWLETSASDRLDTSTVDDWWAALMPKWLTDCVQGRAPWPGTQAEAQALSFRVDEVQPRLPLAIEERASRWLEKAEPAIQGSNGQTTLFEVASHLGGFGLSLGEVQDILWREYNPRCVPPWAPNERGQFERHVREGYIKGPVPIGDKLDDATPAVAVSMDSPPVATGDNGYPTSSMSGDDGATGGASSWPPPAQLEPDFERLPFPVEVLPGWLRQWAVELSEETQTPAEMAGMMGLCAMAAAVAKKRVVHLAGGWYEPLNLWAIVAMLPSSRKSPVFASALAPINEWEREKAEAMQTDIAVAGHALAVEKGRLEQLKTKAIKTKHPAEQADLADQIERKQRDIDCLPVLKAPRLVVDDVTMEMLATVLADHDGRIAIMSDEGAVLGIAAGHYSSGKVHASTLLKGYSGGDIRVDRRNRQEFVRNAAITLGLTVQPAIVRRALANEQFAGNGLLARPLYSFPESNVGSRKGFLDVEPMSDEARHGYNQGIRWLCSMPMPSEPEVMAFEPEAIHRLNAWSKQLEPTLKPTGENCIIGEWAGKLTGTLARICALLWLADDGRGDIPLEVVERGLVLGSYFINHAHYAFAHLRDNDEYRGCLTILEKARDEGWPGQSVRLRDLWRLLTRRFGNKREAFDAAVETLHQMGWIQPVKIGRAHGLMFHPDAKAYPSAEG